MNQEGNAVEKPETRQLWGGFFPYIWCTPVPRGRFERQSEPLLSLPILIGDSQANDQLPVLGSTELKLQEYGTFGNFSLNYLIVLF